MAIKTAQKIRPYTSLSKKITTTKQDILEWREKMLCDIMDMPTRSEILDIKDGEKRNTLLADLEQEYKTVDQYLNVTWKFFKKIK